MPIAFVGGEWHWTPAHSPVDSFHDALAWVSLGQTFPGWWALGAGIEAHDAMDAAMAGAGL